MSSTHPLIPIAGIVVIVGALYYSGGPRSSPRKDYSPLTVTAAKYESTRYNGDRPDATITVYPPSNHNGPWRLGVFDGTLLYEPKDQAGAAEGAKWEYDYTQHRYAFDYTKDIGAWVGFRVARTTTDNDKGDVGLDVGIRFSPLRVAYGVISPDLLVSPRQAGVGVSFYPLSQSVAPMFQHFGVGVAYMADYRGGAGLSPYISLSTRF